MQHWRWPGSREVSCRRAPVNTNADTTQIQDTQLQHISKGETPTAFCALPPSSASCSCSHSSLAAQDIMYRPFLAYKGSKRR
jgi:hypothetical protein